MYERNGIVHRITADKREIKDLPKLPSATSFIRKTLSAMLNDNQTRHFKVIGGLSFVDIFVGLFRLDSFAFQTNFFSWDSPALTFNKKNIADRQSFNKADNGVVTMITFASPDSFATSRQLRSADNNFNTNRKINTNKQKSRKMKQTIIITALAVIALTSCKKEGTGGDATIEGHVMHHSTNIPGATVYIKYGAKESPGTDVSKYDANTQASMGDAHYKFEGLIKGDYYLYAVGYDSAITASVSGGVPVKIKRSQRKETVEANVPVVE